MPGIQLLPGDLINQIAAGEVIERPASVVKELLENAIDAGATQITLEIEHAGFDLIRVVDNGHGMDLADLDLCLERHATSKIATPDDLFNIHTLGFRGEALPSIASVSRFTISSRRLDAAHGWSLAVAGGRKDKPQKTGMPPGTTVEVRDLFFNLPARKKFLKTPATEQKNILETITRYALCRQNIGFEIIADGRRLLHMPSDLVLPRRAARLFGQEFEEKMHVFKRHGAGVSVQGLLSGPELTRPARSGMALYVNGRWVRDSMLSAAVLSGYQGLLMKGSYPIVVLFLDINPAEVDVNVHPAKAEVRFQDSSRIYGLIVSAIREAISTPAQISQPAHTTDERIRLQEPPLPYTIESKSFDHRYLQPAYPTQINVFNEPAATHTTPVFYAAKRVAGTLQNTYILLQDDEALYILDQHAAHERVLYERIRADYKANQSQMLLHPVVVELTHSEYALIEEILPILKDSGIEAEPFGETTLAIRAVHPRLAESDLPGIIRALIHEIHPRTTQNIMDDICASIACHASLRAGKALLPPEITALLRFLDEAGAPMTCPHGRPLFKKITLAEIEKWLGRRL